MSHSQVYKELVHGQQRSAPSYIGEEHDAGRLSLAGHMPQVGSWSFRVALVGMIILLFLAGVGIWALIEYVGHHHHHHCHSFPTLENAGGQCIVEPCQCETIANKDLPLLIDTDGGCYVVVQDLVWSQNNTPAITVTGQHNRIYGQRRSLNVTEQMGQGILVVGTLGIFGPDAPRAGGLDLDQFTVRGSEMLYAYTAYGITVETGGWLRLRDVFVQDFSTGVQNFNAFADVGNLNCTVIADANAPKRLIGAQEQIVVLGVGAICLWSEGSTQTCAERMCAYIKKNNIANSPAGPMYTAAVFHFHNPLPNFRTSQPGSLNIDGFAAFADSGVVALRSRSLVLRNLDVEMSPDPYSVNIAGVVMGCGNNTNGIAERFTIDAQRITPAAMPLIVVASGALLVRDFQVVGRTAPGWVFTDDYLPPHVMYPGLVTIDLFDNSYNVSGVRFERGRITATTAETYCFAIANDALTHPPVSLAPANSTCNDQFAIEVHDIQTTGGRVGLLAGRSLGKYLRVSGSTFNSASYGAFVADGADSIIFEKCAFVKNCVGLYLDDGTGEVLGDSASFYSKNAQHRYLGRTLYGPAPIDGAETEDACLESLPEIYDTCPGSLIYNTGDNGGDSLVPRLLKMGSERTMQVLQRFRADTLTSDAADTLASTGTTTGAIATTA